MRTTITTAAIAATVLTATAAMAADAAVKCEAGKNSTAGKYAACLHKAQSKFVSGGELDTDAYDEAVLACGDKYSSKWQSLETKAEGGCPVTGDETAIQHFLDACIFSAEFALGGGALPTDVATCNTSLGTCNGNLGTCTGSLGTCTGNLGTCTGTLGTCNGSLTTCSGNLSTCQGNLSTTNAELTDCQTDLGAANAGTAAVGDVLVGKTFTSSAGIGETGTMPDNGAVTLTPGTSDQTIAAGYHDGSGKCAGDADLVAGNIKNGVDLFGVTGTLSSGGLPRTGQTTSYGTGSDGNLQKGIGRLFTDNGDGTVTDNATGLMWEKKDQKAGGIHNFNNTYTWGMTSSPYTMNGTMVTAFLATLNTPPCFAGYCDWRIPNIRELESVLDYQKFLPAVDAAFNTSCVANCTIDGAAGTTKCSCTQNSYYWSSTTSPSGLSTAFSWVFDWSYMNSFSKSNAFYVRAIRGGA